MPDPNGGLDISEANALMPWLMLTSRTGMGKDHGTVSQFAIPQNEMTVVKDSKGVTPCDEHECDTCPQSLRPLARAIENRNS